MRNVQFLPSERRQPLQFPLSRCAGVIGHAARSDRSGCNFSGHKRCSSPFARQKRLVTRSRIPRHSPPEQSVLIGDCPGSNGSPAMLALPPPHRWKLFFTGFLHVHSGVRLSSQIRRLIPCFPLLPDLPQTVSLRPFACIHASLFFSSCLICPLPPGSIGGCLSLWKGSIGYTRCVSRGLHQLFEDSGFGTYSSSSPIS